MGMGARFERPETDTAALAALSAHEIAVARDYSKRARRKTYAADDLGDGAGTPTRARLQKMTAWNLDAAATEGVATDLHDLPPEWAGQELEVWVTIGIGGATGATSVVMRYDLGTFRENIDTAGVNIGSPYLTTGTLGTIPIPGATTAIRYARLPGRFTFNPDQDYYLRVVRVGGNAADTYGSDLGLVSVTVKPAVSLVGHRALLSDASASWWCLPRAARDDDGNIIGGGNNRLGDVVFWDGTAEWVLERRSYDEHNIPAILKPDTGGQNWIVAYADHNTEPTVHVRRAAAPTGIAASTKQAVTTAGNATYAQLVRVPGTDTVLLWTRDDATYWTVAISPDDGATWGSPKRVFSFQTQGYLATRRVGGTLRCALIQHAYLGDDHSIYYCEINLATLVVTKSDGTVLADLDTITSPIAVESTLEKAHSATTEGTRLFDISSGTNPEIALATWTTIDDAVYRVARRAGTTWATSDALADAGAVLVDADQDVAHYQAHYHGGMNFPVGATGVMLSSREADGLWIAERWSGSGLQWSPVEMFRSSRKTYRPYGVDGGGLVYNEAEVYRDYDDFRAMVAVDPDVTF